MMRFRRFLELGALVGALSLTACNTETVTTPTPAPAPTPTAVTTVSELRDNMRVLWMQHIVWTRVFLIDSLAGLPDTDAAEARLLQNQLDIGNAIKPFYGEDAGNQLAALLYDHITGVAAVVAAAKAGDMAAFARANAAWYANADQIAQFLANANPSFSETDLENLMHDHLALTFGEAQARLDKDYNADIAAFDSVEMHILMMADSLTMGIATQFPDLVSTANQASVADESVHAEMRRLWEEHVAWTRFFLIADVAGLEDAPQTTARLLQNQVDIGNAIKPYYGAAAGNQLSSLLEVHITDAVTLVNAARAGDQEGAMRASVAWYANADDIASFLASANPNWSVGELMRLMDLPLRQTTQEATDRLKMNWVADIADHDAVETHILHMADVLSGGISAQFPGGLPVIPM
jgi:hypothetical protein